jgi:hypothetical protein
MLSLRVRRGRRMCFQLVRDVCILLPLLCTLSSRAWRDARANA